MKFYVYQPPRNRLVAVWWRLKGRYRRWHARRMIAKTQRRIGKALEAPMLRLLADLEEWRRETRP